MTATAAATVPGRMPARDRRSLLLDAAARVVAASHPGVSSMERVAVAAGVSRPLLYKHFANIDELLIALYRRETAAVGREVWQALSQADAGGDRVRVGVRAYFDALAQRRDVLAALSVPGSRVPALADPGREGSRFVAAVLERFHGVPAARSATLASIVHGALVGAADAWLGGLAGRSELEDEVVAVISRLVQGDAPSGRRPS